MKREIVSLARLTKEMELLDLKLKPIGETPVFLEELRSPERLALVEPLDQAGIRVEAEALLEQLIKAYSTGEDKIRREIRGLFEKYRYFAWAAIPQKDPSTEDGFRSHLVHFSMKDQGPDPRDEKLRLDWMVGEAKKAGLKIEKVISEVAEMSSREDRYSWGATRDWLLRLL